MPLGHDWFVVTMPLGVLVTDGMIVEACLSIPSPASSSFSTAAAASSLTSFFLQHPRQQEHTTIIMKPSIKAQGLRGKLEASTQ